MKCPRKVNCVDTEDGEVVVHTGQDTQEVGVDSYKKGPMSRKRRRGYRRCRRDVNPAGVFTEMENCHLAQGGKACEGRL